MRASGNKDVGLARADMLAKSSSAALRRLNRRVECLEQDVLPVHEETKMLVNAHRNIGLAMADLGTACAQLRVVVRLQEMLESAHAQRDWDRLFPCLEEVKATLAFLRAHPTLGQHDELVTAVEEVQLLAMQCLQSQYIGIVEAIPTFSHGDGEQKMSWGDRGAGVGAGGEEAERARSDLARLRAAMITAGRDVAPALLQELRTEAATASLLRAQRVMEGRHKGGVEQVASQLLNLLLYERGLFAHVLAAPAKEDGHHVDGGGGAWGEGGEGAKTAASTLGKGPALSHWPATRARQGEEVSMSEDGRAAFGGFCQSLAQVFVRMVDKAVAAASGPVPSDAPHAEWGAAAGVAWRLDVALALLDLHQDLTRVMEPIVRLLQDAPGGAAKGSPVPALQGLQTSVTRAGAKALGALLRAVAGAGSSGGGQTPAIARNGGKGGGKEGRELLDSSRLPVTRLVSLNSARLLESRQQYEALVAAHDSLLAPKTRSHGAVSARTARCTCCQDFELPAECGEYVWLLWGQLEANLRVRQQSFRDLSLGFVFAINNLYLLASLLDQLPDLRQTMRQAGQEVQDAIDDNCDKLIQRCWLAPLQSLSSVHLPSSQIMAQESAHLTQAQRHEIKEALTAFNVQVEKTLSNQHIHIEDTKLRSSLAQHARAFVLPVYEEFLDKFGKLPFSTKNTDKYIIYSPKSLGEAIQKRFLGSA